MTCVPLRSGVEDEVVACAWDDKNRFLDKKQEETVTDSVLLAILFKIGKSGRLAGIRESMSKRM